MAGHVALGRRKAWSRLATAAALCVFAPSLAAQSGGASTNFGAGQVFRGNYFGGSTGAGVRGGWVFAPGFQGGVGGGRFGPGNVGPGFGLGVPLWTQGRFAGRPWYGNRFNQSGLAYPYGLGYGLNGLGYGLGGLGYGLNGLGYGLGYPGVYGGGLYYGPGAYRQDVPTGPSFANPAPIQPPAEVAPPLEAPVMPESVASTEDKADFGDLRARFASASAKVTSARQSVEEIRARLASIGQTPRAETLSRLTLAEAALSQAQARMAAGNLAEARDEIRRADYVAQQVLKEFGR